MSENPVKEKMGLAESLRGDRRMSEIYQGALSGKRISVPTVLEALERMAKEALSPEAWDYVAGGAGGDDSVRENRAGLGRWRIMPRMLRNVSERDLKIELLGETLPAPVLLGPVGVQGIVHKDAEVATARAAGSLGVPFVLSTVSSRSMEVVAQEAGTGTAWFQLYWSKDRELAASFLGRAEAAGYKALVLTLDIPILGWRERDLQHPYLPFLFGEGMANYLSDPVFRSRLGEPPEKNPAGAVKLWTEVFSNPGLAWSDLAWLRKATRLPILLKGILRPDDAARALEYGVDGLIVSNHGGRQVEGGIAAIDALPGVVEAVRGRVPVLFDSGIRRGADALKALALGARAILLGRLYIWGLAAAGEQGVLDVVRNFIADLDITLGNSGCTNISEFGREMLARVPQ